MLENANVEFISTTSLESIRMHSLYFTPDILVVDHPIGDGAAYHSPKAIGTLRAIAKESNCVVFALSELNENIASLNDHLSASELYQIVEVADPELIRENQLVVHRDEFYHGADYDSVMSDFKVFFYNTLNLFI